MRNSFAELSSKIKISPNPLSDKSIIKIENSRFSIGYFQLFNSSGKKVYEREFKNAEFFIARGNLAAGIYFYKIESEDLLINSGKILIE